MHVARVQKTWRTWLGHVMSRARAKCLNPGPHDPKSGPPRDFEVSLDYVVSLVELQGGRCAMTGLPLLREFGHPNTASIDRKDGSFGYVEGNVQLVCQWVNFAKRDWSVEQFSAVLEELRELWSHSQ